MNKEKTCLYAYPTSDSLNTNVAIIICPGGSYAHLYGIKTEGFGVAEWLNKNGITAFVLKYRVGKNGYHHPAMIEDVQRAIQWVRENAKKYNINPELLGVMGFSAGGHLSLMSGIFFDENYLIKYGFDNSINLKPSFVVPVYPVVSMQDEIAHKRSRKNLLTRKFTQTEKNKFSMEMQVLNSNISPVFLVATKDDPVVDYKNSVVLVEALKKYNAKHKFLLYETGGHGFGMDKEKAGAAALWNIEFIKWLGEQKILKN
ncbi:alpha/beta hydrolase [Bacteroidales bacterium OttesenSCG-928-I21]|nr:alpha/beta hydrolase [Bacteroidales bacterium OttesenSCG-928-I21]